jgi:hypothetical protein
VGTMDHVWEPTTFSKAIIDERWKMMMVEEMHYFMKPYMVIGWIALKENTNKNKVGL